MYNKKGGLSLKKFWIPLFIFVVAVILFYKVVDKLPQVFTTLLDLVGVVAPFIGGLIIAFILYKPAYNLEKLFMRSKSKVLKRRARGLSVLGCYGALIVILVIVLYLLVPRVFSGVVSLVENMPAYYNSAVKYIEGLVGEDGKLLGIDVSRITESISVGNVISYFDLSKVGNYLVNIFSATGAIVDVFLAFVVSVYVLLGRGHLIKVGGNVLGMVIPREKVHALHKYMVRISAIFYNYIYSQLLDAVIVSVCCLIIFSIIGVPYALVMAVLMGLCNIIPYFGAIIGGGAVVIVTLISGGDFIKALIVLVCILVVQQLDANLIQPRIVADTVGLRPVYVLLAIMIGSGLFGFVGMLICVPVMAVVRMIIADYLKNLNGKDTFIVKKQKELSSEKSE